MIFTKTPPKWKPLTATTSTGVWSDTGTMYSNDMGTAAITDDIIDPIGGTLNVPLTLQLTLTSQMIALLKLQYVYLLSLNYVIRIQLLKCSQA